MRNWLQTIFLGRRRDPVENMPEGPRVINFRADDNHMQRAENIWFALGHVNDRFGSIPQIAGYLSMYAEWDKDRRTL